MRNVIATKDYIISSHIGFEEKEQERESDLYFYFDTEYNIQESESDKIFGL